MSSGLAAVLHILYVTVPLGLCIGLGLFIRSVINGAKRSGYQNLYDVLRSRGGFNPQREFIMPEGGIAFDMDGGKFFIAQKTKGGGLDGKIYPLKSLLKYMPGSSQRGQEIDHYVEISVDDIRMPLYRIWTGQNRTKVSEITSIIDIAWRRVGAEASS